MPETQNYNFTKFDKKSERTAFIGGLFIKSTEEEIKQHIQKLFPNLSITAFGLVKRKNKEVSKGFGFMTFQTREELLFFIKQKIIFKGKKIDIREAQNYEKLKLNLKDYFSCRILLKNLPKDLDDLGLKRLFSDKYKIQRAYVIKDCRNGISNGLGFVDFFSKQDVNHILQQSSMIIGNNLVELVRYNHNMKKKLRMKAMKLVLYLRSS